MCAMRLVHLIIRVADRNVFSCLLKLTWRNVSRIIAVQYISRGYFHISHAPASFADACRSLPCTERTKQILILGLLHFRNCLLVFLKPLCHDGYCSWFLPHSTGRSAMSQVARVNSLRPTRGTEIEDVVFRPERKTKARFSTGLHTWCFQFTASRPMSSRHCPHAPVSMCAMIVGPA